jgi:hypothetical protein
MLLDQRKLDLSRGASASAKRFGKLDWRSKPASLLASDQPVYHFRPAWYNRLGARPKNVLAGEFLGSQLKIGSTCASNVLAFCFAQVYVPLTVRLHWTSGNAHLFSRYPELEQATADALNRCVDAHLAMAAMRHPGHMERTVALILSRQTTILRKMNERSPFWHINNTSRDIVRRITKEKSKNGAD